MAAGNVVIIILLVGLVAFAVAYFVAGPGRRRGRRPAGDIPLALRPYHSDEELEGEGLTRGQAWGVVLVLFMAFFLPVYWLLEPTRIDEKQDEFFHEDVERGRLLFADACAQCHGADGGGGSAAHPDPDVDAPWPAPPLNNIVARYEDDERFSTDQEIVRFITETVKQGRPGTPMPPWLSFYGGGFNEQQVESIVRYVLSIQTGEEPELQAFEGADGEEIFQANCARCHGQDARGGLAPDLRVAFDRHGGEDAEEAIRSIIENGIRVPNGTDMPRWENRLSEDAIDRLLEYLRSIQEEQGQ